ncbi:MAG TPA: methionyl-tRNA formyltransferase [Terriglobales bacterium]|nr:methionyl-tRNA formyltransferase [Terriglobales bacterium]
MDLVFCGTPQFSVPTLDKLVEAGFRLRLVLTQPDRPSGRSLGLAPQPVKQRASELSLPLLQPDKIKNNLELRAALESIQPDAIVVVGYGRIIPPWMIAIPRFGNLNLHASLLPKHRGAAPVQWAIASGETVTGVTTMRIDPGLDTGDILLQKEVPIAPEDTAVTLAPRLAELGAALMVETLHGLLAGSIQPVPQDHSRATLAPLLKKEDGRIDFQRPAVEIGNRLRGFQPWPGAWTGFRGKHLQVHAARPLDRLPNVRPGELAVQGERLLAGCGQDTGLELLEVQVEGKKRMSARDFLHGYRPQPGEVLAAPPAPAT